MEITLFCKEANIDIAPNYLEKAIMLGYYHQKTTKSLEFDTKIINNYFEKIHLPKQNSSRLESQLRDSPKTIKAINAGFFKLHKSTLDAFEQKLGYLFQQENMSISTRVNFLETPYLGQTEIDEAKKMAELYIVLHCLENSVRRFINDTFTKVYGKDWWDTVGNGKFNSNVKQRKEKEQKQKWITPRGDSPLFYIDWSDLVAIISNPKYAANFANKIPEIDFVRLRLGELESFRNIIAHNGFLPNNDDFDRIILHFKDWCKQLK